MNKQNVLKYLNQYEGYIPKDKIIVLKKYLEKADDDMEEGLAFVKIKNPNSVLLASIFGGFLGIDRFIIGDVGFGICKILFSYITCGILPLVDIFFSHKKAREINMQNILRVL